jgi:hypothetical protein
MTGFTSGLLCENLEIVENPFNTLINNLDLIDLIVFIVF